ncbi:hypothetical protein CW357_18150 [Rummeliibacillus sp. TYF005]|uniref:hypothetical protein n=1 Tax=Rummeliibacillus sp. TYF005 TaxID=2058214 RepID=UPI000F51DA0D|nr:hypothetical protein [Rummeliibacillus sp. TYF005]RPJ93920.1 hypothetical protein CW357_18150 [Rummeliibacillus sp. TYF005]
MENNNFIDLSDSNEVNYEVLIFFLKQGREIEFTYNGKEYFIPNHKEGRVLLNEEGDNLNNLNPYIKNPEEFVIKATINGLTLKEIFQNQNDKIEFGTIF